MDPLPGERSPGLLVVRAVLDLVSGQVSGSVFLLKGSRTDRCDLQTPEEADGLAAGEEAGESEDEP